MLLNALSMGCVVQVNAVSSAMEGIWGISPWVSGGVLLLLTLPVMLKGSRRVAGLTEILVPVMTAGYLILTVAVLVLRWNLVDDAMKLIFRDAFSFTSMGGGVLGFLTSRALRTGTMRGLLSNEAGAGTSAYAHAKSEQNDPVAEGILGMGEILFDTVILCMLTAFSILLSVENPSAYQSGIDLLSAAFFSALGKSYRIPLFVSVFLFALSTAVCWYEYGRCALRFLGQHGGALFFTLYVCAALLGAHLGSMTLIPLCDTLLFFLTVIALPPLLKNATATCALTEQTLHIGKAA
jgi:AGCS family alanine or glycine:cation symporter